MIVIQVYVYNIVAISTRNYCCVLQVTLELGWSYPSDMWSAGCIVAEVGTAHEYPHALAQKPPCHHC
jgi:hypothetical protein